MRLCTFLFLAALALALLAVPGRAENEEITRVKEIFTNAGARNICTTGESSTRKESKAAGHAGRPTEAVLSHARP